MSKEQDILKEWVSRLDVGPISDPDTNKQFKSHITDNWDTFQGGHDGGMKWEKLYRMESPAWEPPFLRFDIERHGGTVKGSIYADVQRWSINVETWKKDFAVVKRRQLFAKDARLDTKKLAGEIAELILSGSPDGCRLKWDGPNKFTIEIGEVIPASNQQTTSSRRKRFISQITPLLTEHGWVKQERINRHVFEKLG